VIGGNGAVLPERIEHFFRDAREGTLPDFAIIDPDFHVNDQHPPHTMAMGEAFLGAVVRAIEESPQWSRTLLVVTYDENGGFFDHVPPPPTVDARPEFAQLGFRVPTLLIGPSVWAGRILSTQFEHVSVLATLRSRFGMDSLGPRMDATTDLASCIDPDRVGVSSPPRLRSYTPADLPRAHLDMARSWTNSQEEMDLAVRSGRVPDAHVDPRPFEDRLAAWLDPAQELGAVRIVR